ncbi:hypothetical protein EVAR_70254_1 [Eumeta japonica]|uniref:Uncharacterized protein n=1 Tax=Eumeta variegata TaxID=151549 RepID=A0A4C2A4Y6_EUMVA|nr:hypothetical protein EVAR_70254_1 [Eumeta japonica]
MVTVGVGGGTSGQSGGTGPGGAGGERRSTRHFAARNARGAGHGRAALLVTAAAHCSSPGINYSGTFLITECSSLPRRSVTEFRSTPPPSPTC